MIQTNTIIDIRNISKSFLVGHQKVEVLRDINLQVKSEDFMVIFGPSGCGKSTLLHTILGLEEPSMGSVSLLGQSVYQNTNEDDRSLLRKSHVGMVYQQPNWIKSLKVWENVAFPLVLSGEKRSDFRQKVALEHLDLFGMAGWSNYFPAELSSGQQQLVALSRALISNPEIIIADEPTGNLDFENSQKLMQILAKINKENGKTILMVTHDLEYLNFAKTGVQMLDGRIVDIYDQTRHEKMMSNANSKRSTQNGLQK